MPRHETPDEKARWAEYMRNYRATHAESDRTKGAPTARQIEVLRIYADPELGGTEKKVAEYLGISKPAVHNHLQRLMRRLGVRNQAQAIVKLWQVNTDGTTSNDAPPDDQARGRLRPRRSAGRKDGHSDGGA